MDFLTPEEREQMEVLMAKAAERIQKNKANACRYESDQFLFVRCQLEGRQHVEREQREKVAAIERDITILMNQVCSFCQKHCIPVYKNTEDALPF